VLLRGRINARGILIVTASALSVLWAADLAIPGVLLSVDTGTVLNSLRLSGWLVLLVVLVGRPHNPKRRLFSPVFLAVVFAAVVIGCDLGMLIDARLGTLSGSGPNNALSHISLSIAGLLAAENVLRNADKVRRQNISPLCLALGATFAFELFVHADQLLMRGSSNPVLYDGRGIIGIFTVPLIAMAIVRNREWRVDIHVSRAIVLHTAALITSGLFFISISAVGIVVRKLEGGWGPTLQVLMLLGSTIVLIAVFGAREVRVYLTDFISRHFYSHRFDYRVEWLRFVDTVSAPTSPDDHLSIRIVRALAKIIESPAGALWCIHEENCYYADIGWNVALPQQRLAIADPFISGFGGGDWIQVQSTTNAHAGRLFGTLCPWIAIPLVHGEMLIAFVVLSVPRSISLLDTETFNLLRAAGKQAASYLAEEHSARALSDARLLTDFSKRFAFVLHDIKNLASQLGLVVANARCHLDDAEFRQDMLCTLDNSVDKLNRLLGQLRVGIHSSPQQVEPDVVITELVQELSNQKEKDRRIETRLGGRGCAVKMDSDQLRSVLHHLVNNAREASQAKNACAEGRVIIASRCTGDKIMIDVVDSGPGMDDNFIRDELFRPFSSTKIGGLGIGVYQTRELLRMSGGDLDVISRKGVGTTMRMILPMAKQPHLISVA
jgi:putative PEP-CTERM system histidine kinase